MAVMTVEARSVFWAGKRVLVTGAAGFIGSHLTEALVRTGADVRAFVRYNSRNDYGWLEAADQSLVAEVEIFRGDLANPEAVRGAVDGCNVVLHLGALIPIPYSYRHPREFVTANVIATLNVLEACRGAEISRLVHTSTSEVYGTAVRVPIDEEHRLQAQSPYAATKVGADKLALSYQQSFDTPVVVARPFNTFGPRQTARAIIPTIITQGLTQERIQIGSTTPTRDFLYVEDTVEGMMRCAEQSGIEGEVFNLGTGTEISIGETADKIQALLGVERPIEQSDDRRRPPNSEVERLVADCSKAAEQLDWRPRVEFDEGLRRTLEWIRTSLSSYKPSIYNV
jgi:NAD dependent epimerase/dehydratase